MNPLKLIKYAKFFSSSKFLNFATGVGKNVAFLRRAAILFYCFRDPDTPKYVKSYRGRRFRVFDLANRFSIGPHSVYRLG